LAQSKIASGVSIKSAARELGFSSPATLTRVFTKRVGCSPRDWALQASNR
jgi:AraC-like DNA-binding protein